MKVVSLFSAIVFNVANTSFFVQHDPVYGTPVFETVAGRSLCLHEPKTDVREVFDIRFPSAENLLDMTGSFAQTKARSLTRTSGASCVEFYLDLYNQTPHSDRIDIELFMKPPDDTTTYGNHDTVGLTFSYATDMPIGSAEMFVGGDDRRVRGKRQEKHVAINKRFVNSAWILMSSCH